MSSIHSYGYKPYPIFKTSHDEFEETSEVKELLFGVELEIDKGEDAGLTSDELTELTDDIYCKHDGSLGDEGIEIVTHPCTLEYHMTKLPWDGIAKIAKDHDYLSHEARTCGLHVHVGRFQMGRFESERDQAAGKVVILVSRFWKEMVTFSRRTNGQLIDWANLPLDDFGVIKENVINLALETYNKGRYQAVNLQNSSTIEFRLFNGTLDMDTLKATLQLVSNIVTYATNHDIDDIIASQWQDIIDVAHYDELSCYLNELGLSLVPPKPAIQFEYASMEEFEEGQRKRYEEAERRHQVEERIRREQEERRRREHDAIRRALDLHVGDRVRIVNAEGSRIGCLRAHIGEKAIVSGIYDIAERHTFDFELMFPDTCLNRFDFHGSNFSTNPDANLYYNVHAENIERVREAVPVDDPVVATDTAAFHGDYVAAFA